MCIESWYNRYKKQPQESMPHKQAPEGSAVPRGGKVREGPKVPGARESGANQHHTYKIRPRPAYRVRQKECGTGDKSAPQARAVPRGGMVREGPKVPGGRESGERRA